MPDPGELNRELEGLRRQVVDLDRKVTALAPSARTVRLEQRVQVIEQRAIRALAEVERVTAELAARLEPEEPTLVGAGRGFEPPPTEPAPELESAPVEALDAADVAPELGPAGAD